MTLRQYNKIEAWFRCHPTAFRLLRIFNRYLPRIAYVAYPVAAVLLFWQHDSRLLRYLLVPAIAFFFCTIIRHKLNRPRPYEVWQIRPLILKNKAGHSFPSRHMTCAAVIATAFWYLSLPLGLVMTAIAILIAFVRVFAGIHFTKDVIVGGLIGFVIGLIGFWGIP